MGYCVKSVRIRSYSGPHFHAFGLNTEKDGVHLRIQSECWKIRIRITPNMDTFHAWGSPKIDKMTVKYHESDFKKIM